MHSLQSIRPISVILTLLIALAVMSSLGDVPSSAYANEQEETSGTNDVASKEGTTIRSEEDEEKNAGSPSSSSSSQHSRASTSGSEADADKSSGKKLNGRSEGSSEVSGEGDKKQSKAKNQDKKKPIPKRRNPEDWNKLSDKDIDKMLHDISEEDKDEYDFDPMKEPKMPSIPEKEWKNPETHLKYSKLGKPLMVVVDLFGNRTKKETDDIMARWQIALQNAHIEAQRFTIEVGKGIFMVNDGPYAWDIKNFLINQPELKECTIDGTVYKPVQAILDEHARIEKEEERKRKREEKKRKNNAESDTDASKKIEKKTLSEDAKAKKIEIAKEDL